MVGLSIKAQISPRSPRLIQDIDYLISRIKCETLINSLFELVERLKSFQIWNI